MSVELRPLRYNRAVINAVNDTTVFLDLHEELFQNPLWVVNGIVVDVNYIHIWEPGISAWAYYPGVCRITTNRCKIGIIVDGIWIKTVNRRNGVGIEAARGTSVGEGDV